MKPTAYHRHVHNFLLSLQAPIQIVAQDIREKMRKMGALAGVPIEPPEQTKLLNACVSQAGVIGGGVPGGVPFIVITTFSDS